MAISLSLWYPSFSQKFTSHNRTFDFEYDLRFKSCFKCLKWGLEQEVVSTSGAPFAPQNTLYVYPGLLRVHETRVFHRIIQG